MADNTNSQMADQQGGQNFVITFENEGAKAGKYCNAVSVHVNTNEVVADFGYTIPGTTPQEIRVVERMNMNHRTAEQFVSVLQNSLLDFRNKIKEHQAKQAPSAE